LQELILENIKNNRSKGDQAGDLSSLEMMPVRIILYCLRKNG